MKQKRGDLVLFGRKAQLTLFIILGILVIIGMSLYLISSEKVSVREQEIEEKQEVPSKFNAAKLYVENCIAKVVEDGLVRIGQTGGYIEPRRYGITSNPSEPTDGMAVRFDPGNEDTATVYWWHFKSNNRCVKDCQCGSERPNLKKSQGEPSIEGQLSRYINENLRNCIKGFEELKKKGYNIQELSQISSNVIVLDGEVGVTVNYPLKIILADSEITIKQYIVSIPIDIARIFEFASKITNTEIKYPVLERWTLEQINAFGLGIDENGLPPTAEATFDTGSEAVHWQKSDAKNLMQFLILPYYTGLLQVWRTSNYDERGGYYQRATIPINDTYSDLKVNFEYLSWWPIFFDIKGRGVRGNFIGPETGGVTGILSWLGLKRYDFNYDVSYPIKVDIYDSSALNSRGYHFMFILEANVRGNKPINCSSGELPITTPPTGTLICDPRNYCANITVEITSKFDNTQLNTQLEDIAIAYGYEGEVCDIGGGDGSKTIISLPQCVGQGCTIQVSKYNLFSTPKSLSVRCDLPSNHPTCSVKNVVCNNGEVTVNVEPIKAKNVSVMKKRNIKTTAWVYDPAPVPLLNNEYAVIYIQKIKDIPEEPDLYVQTIYYGNQTNVGLYPGLVPGNYQVTIDLYYSLPDANGRTQIVFKDKKIDNQNVHIEPFNETFNEGSVTYNWTLSHFNLGNSKEIVFYGISSPDSASFDNLDAEDIGQIGRSEIIGNQNRLSIEPSYK